MSDIGRLAFVALVVWPLSAGPALALSCVRQTPEGLAAAYLDSAQDHIVAHGTLSPVDPLPRYNRDTLLYEPQTMRARFEGHVASPTGFDLAAAFPVTVDLHCMDEVCGAMPDDVAGAMLLRQTVDGLVFDRMICNRTLVIAPTEADLQTLIGCLDSKDCAVVYPR